MYESMWQRLMARLKNIVGVGTITGAKTSVVQIKTSTGRTNDRIDRVHNYGFMSRPLIGAKTYSLFLGGVTARGFTIHVSDKRYEMELEPGEVAMLDDKGNLTHFTETGIKVVSVDKVEVKAEGDVTVDTPGQILQNGKLIKLNGGTGIITCESVCPFMGKSHVDGSKTVMAGKQ
ncbi:phage baseplate assembly protein domain-containing protein [Vibrio scophthalmi]|uniref:Bacteriophage Mu Gp45 N-terminal domain-containing protein n=1 Tax=Vibrio scophthalmi TaxID=45658 RepID=A0A1E3WJS3_9VIBR|nr:phage baseplate assembly protein [Vibrio scophthalmi]ODS09757.1 hypothetical protein VSF3289_03219 [Vibrio scophthalmi]